MARYLNISETRKETKKIDLTLLKYLLKESQVPPTERPTVPAMRKVRVPS